jgi:pyruvate kinase
VRHTKIVATLGPATDTDAAVDALVRAGVDVFRLNFSHGTHEGHAATYARVRQAADRAGRLVAIMQDLSGPKIRTGRLPGGRAIPVPTASELRIATGDFVGEPGRVSTGYAELARSVRPGDTLLLDDGRIELQVESTDGTEIRTRVVNGGDLGEHKGINAPGVPLPASAITDKDVDDLDFGLGLGVDLVALSFVQTAGDLRRARALASAAGRAEVPLVAKLERPQAIEHLDDILREADAVMVARGDLGLELPLEQVPRVQKEITHRARLVGLPVIVATQVLESMCTEPRPTRAEVSDAANAVDSGADAIMLSGETAIGAFPVRAVQALDAIIRDAETTTVPPAGPFPGLPGPVAARALSEAAATLAGAGEVDAIVAITREGTTPRLLAALRPQAPIFAATDRAEVARRLALYHGVMPVVVSFAEDNDATRARVADELCGRGFIKAGGTVVFVSVNPDLRRTDSNFLKLQQVGTGD